MINGRPETIFVISPFKNVPDALQKVHKICREIILAGDIPIAPHGYFTLFLNDNDEGERYLGMRAGRVLMAFCDKARIYEVDTLFKSEGMQGDLVMAGNLHLPIEQKVGDEIKPFYACSLCKGGRKILHFYERGPGDPPGNREITCPDCNGTGLDPTKGAEDGKEVHQKGDEEKDNEEADGS